MERCCGQATMVHADHVNSWWGVEILIPLLKHTNEFYFVLKFHVRPMPTRGKYSEHTEQFACAIQNNTEQLVGYKSTQNIKNNLHEQYGTIQNN
jgi:hypothetical protein